jgi:hypothetical protein
MICRSLRIGLHSIALLEKYYSVCNYSKDITNCALSLLRHTCINITKHISNAQMMEIGGAWSENNVVSQFTEVIAWLESSSLHRLPLILPIN